MRAPRLRNSFWTTLTTNMLEQHCIPVIEEPIIYETPGSASIEPYWRWLNLVQTHNESTIVFLAVTRIAARIIYSKLLWPCSIRFANWTMYEYIVCLCVGVMKTNSKYTKKTKKKRRAHHCCWPEARTWIVEWGSSKKNLFVAWVAEHTKFLNDSRRVERAESGWRRQNAVLYGRLNNTPNPSMQCSI